MASIEDRFVIDPNTHRAHQQALLVILEEFDRVCRQLNIPYVLFAGTMLGAVRHQGFIPWDDDVDVMMLRSDYDRFLSEAEKILDHNKFFLQKEFSLHWPMFFSKLRLNGTTCLEKVHLKDPSTHQGVYIDIFPCDAACKSELGRRIQFLASKVVIAKSLDRRGYDTNSRIKQLFLVLCRILPYKPFLKLVKHGNPNSSMVHSFLGGARSYSKNVYLRRFFSNRIDVEFEGKYYPISAEYDTLLKTLYADYMQIPPPEARKYKQHAVLIDLSKSYEAYTGYHDGIEFEIHTRSIR